METLVWDGGAERVFAFSGGEAVLRPRDGGLRIELPYTAAFGGGERYHTVNLKGYEVEIAVEEKFCEQGEKAYCPAPFFFTDSGFGLYIDTGAVCRFDFRGGGHILVDMPLPATVTLFSGTARTILADYMSLSGTTALPPRWAFLPWISANRWNTQAMAERQLELLRRHDFPAGVIVLEAWSDEATFYIFNGAEYTPKPYGAFFSYADFTFPKDGPWPNPKAMVEKFHEAGLRVVLWQIPAYRQQGAEETPSAQHGIDRVNVVENGLCVTRQDGSPYTIPEGHWFAGSMLPDFTNPETCREWFGKRRYLLDMGIDGFKTDGGEFLYQDDIRFSNGADGAAMHNAYAQSYTKAYMDFLPAGKVLFSRAGYTGQHTTPILWAGDQQSTFAELHAQLRAGLSAAMSGIVFWAFDIGGFAGKLPSADLYLRATQMACFCPVMQWHSEPDGGQFREIMATDDANNERSPWNIAERSGDPLLLERVRFYHKLRVALEPYIYAEAERCAAQNRPLMYPLPYEFMEDANTRDIDDEFMLGGEYLVAPVLRENTTARDVYLPQGVWEDYWSGERYDGRQTIRFEHSWHIPVYRRVKS